MYCRECVHYVPRNDYEGTCVKNPPVPVVQMQSREYPTDNFVSHNENGNNTYGTGRLKTFFARPDVLAQDVSGCCEPKESVEGPITSPLRRARAKKEPSEPTEPSNDDDDDDKSESSVLYFFEQADTIQ